MPRQPTGQCRALWLDLWSRAVGKWREPYRGEEKPSCQSLLCRGSGWQSGTDECGQEPQPARASASARGKQLSPTAERSRALHDRKGISVNTTIYCSSSWDPLSLRNSRDSNRDSVFWRWWLDLGWGSRQPGDGEIWEDSYSPELYHWVENRLILVLHFDWPRVSSTEIIQSHGLPPSF